MTGWWIGWSAGSWGTSWGDIPVAETWDTDQGVARNLAKNLKFSHVEDAEARPASTGVSSGFVDGPATGNAYTKAAGGGAYSGAFDGRSSGTATSANAFIRVAATGVSAGGGSVTAHANSYAIAVGGFAGSGYRVVGRTADSLAIPVSVPCSSGSMRVVANGVLNPSDEELLAVINLLTGKHKRSMVRAIT